MRTTAQLTRFLLILTVLLTSVSTVSAKENAAYQTGFDRWRAADGGFAGWSLSGVTRNAAGELAFDPATSTAGTDPYAAGAYYGGNYYNGGSFYAGEATSPIMTADFKFSEAIASWNASTPAGTWIEVQIRARVTGVWTKWYNLGIWAADAGTIQRHSVKLQGDNSGYVAVDTLVLTDKKAGADAYQLDVRLFSANNISIPTVKNVSLAYSTTPLKKAASQPGVPAMWNTLLAVPECSQMVYPDGGEVWCSPTSTSMVLGFYGFMPGAACAPRVQATVDGVFDWIYDGHGNWPFNTAFAAAQGYEAYVARFTSLAQAEPWVKAGVPVIVSFAWGKNELTGAAIPSSSGHLSVLVGFDAQGNPIINDPAAATDDAVQRTYLRSEFEPLWLTASGGTVYLIYPVGMTVPDL